MRIECPSCLTAYEVPDHKITGKKVRCAKCGTDWAPPVPPPPPDEMAIVPAPVVAVAVPGSSGPGPKPFLAAPEAGSLQPIAMASRAPTPRRGLLITAWIATVVLVVAIVAVADIRRDAVMNAWPPSQRLYAWVGLH